MENCCQKCLYNPFLHYMPSHCRNKNCDCHKRFIEDHSHYHCWDQEKPACGMKSHVRCCLCEKTNPNTSDTLQPVTDQNNEILIDKPMQNTIYNCAGLPGCSHPMGQPCDCNCHPRCLRPNPGQDSEVPIEAFIRDVTKVPPMPKSEVRERLGKLGLPKHFWGEECKNTIHAGCLCDAHKDCKEIEPSSEEILYCDRQNGSNGKECKCICHQEGYALPKDFPKPSSDWEEEFDKLLLEDGIPSENHELYGEGSISEWLKANDDKHLFSSEVYGEPMLDLDADKVKDFIRNLFQTEKEKMIKSLELKELTRSEKARLEAQGFDGESFNKGIRVAIEILKK